MFTTKRVRVWLLAAFVAETLCATFCLKIPAISKPSTFVYFISGIAIALLATALPQVSLSGSRLADRKINSKIRYLKALVLVVIALAVYLLSKRTLQSIDINAAYADMLPVIQKMNQRFIDGHWKKVYDIIPDIWHGTQPVYLPAMWLPFAPAVLFGFDMRWITAGCIFVVFAIFILVLRPAKNPYSSLVLLGMASLLFCWLLIQDEEHGFISMSEEGVVVVYYVLLVLAIMSDQVWLIGIAAALCLLSRFSLIGAIPALLCYLMLHKRNKQALLLSLIGVGSFLVFFILPFGWRRFSDLLSLPAQYVHFSHLVWKNDPDVFLRGLGFAKFFGPANASVLHLLLIVLTFAVPVSYVLFTYLKNKSRPVPNLALAALKLSIVVFYCFIDVPYLYLYYTSSFISLIGVTFLISAGHPRSERPLDRMLQVE